MNIQKKVHSSSCLERDPRIPLNTLLEPRIRYMGNEENILSLEALQRIYLMVAENLKLG